MIIWCKNHYHLVQYKQIDNNGHEKAMLIMKIMITIVIKIMKFQISNFKNKISNFNLTVVQEQSLPPPVLHSSGHHQWGIYQVLFYISSIYHVYFNIYQVPFDTYQAYIIMSCIFIIYQVPFFTYMKHISCIFQHISKVWCD